MSSKTPGEQEKFTPILDRFLTQAISLANDAAHSPLGARLKEQVEQFVDEAGPQVSKVVNEYTKEISNPYQLGMGLQVDNINDEEIETSIPHRWRNRNERGSIHKSALMALAEFTARSFWERHLQNVPCRLTLEEIQGKFFEDSFRQVRATMNVSLEESEQKIFEVKTNGQTTLPSIVVMKKRGGIKAAEFHMTWSVDSPLKVKVEEAQN